MRRLAWYRLLLIAVLGIAACTTTVVQVEPSRGDLVSVDSLVLGNPGTLVPPTSAPSQTPLTAQPDALEIEPLIAFMGACVAEDGLTGPCHCAVERMEPSFREIDIMVLEDRMAGALEFPPELATALVECRNAEPPPPWPAALRQQYLHKCRAGSDQLDSLCECSLRRAQQVVPAHRLDDFLDSDEARPDLVDFLNSCL